MSRLRRTVSALIAGLGLVAVTVVVAEPAYAGSAPNGCTTVRQLGSTHYVTGPDGTVAASMKQFIGDCVSGQRNWAYVWIWDQARAKWDVRVDSIAIAAKIDGTWVTKGLRWGGKGEREVLSDPTATVPYCTYAFGWIGFYDSTGGRYVSVQGYTATVC
ncbi:hypothetical protein AB0H43_36260 [Hamadaea sp. NPDC050747]|uniref:hypothetical protein n=1 Tax=Hamadaea sp. NPDC050747 TaxID=3155789 RepID=UPI00340500FD